MSCAISVHVLSLVGITTGVFRRVVVVETSITLMVTLRSLASILAIVEVTTSAFAISVVELPPLIRFSYTNLLLRRPSIILRILKFSLILVILSTIGTAIVFLPFISVK